MQKIPFLKLVFLYFCTTICASELTAQSAANALLQKASVAYHAKNYSTAIDIYQKLLQKNGKSAGVEYNLANAYYRENLLGYAILHYERGAKIAPYDADIRNNLAIAQRAQVDNIIAIRQFFLIRWAKKLRNLASSDSWAAIGLLFMTGFAAGFLFWLFGNDRNQKRKGFLYGILLLLLSILPFYASYDLSSLEIHSGFAIILASETPMHSAPDAESEMILLLHNGLKVELLDTIGDWLKIALPNGDQGWIQMETVEEI